MKFINFFLMMLFFLLSKANAADFEIQKSHQTIFFNGAISFESSEALIKSFTDEVKILVINSQGGDAVAAFEILKKIKDKNISLVVDKYCFSACANYLFVGATTKSLRSNALLGFHGGLDESAKFDNSVETSVEIENALAPIKRLASEEEAFFSQIGFDRELISISLKKTKLQKSVEEYVVTYGDKKVEFDSSEKVEQFLNQFKGIDQNFSIHMRFGQASPWKMYFPSKSILLKYGVKGIVDYPYPKNQMELNNLAKVYSERLEAVGDFD